MAGDSEHGKVIKGIKVVFADAPFSSRLNIWNFRSGITKVSDQATKIEMAIACGPHGFHHLPVVEPKACVVFDQRNIRNTPDKLIVESADEKHETVFTAFGL